MRALSVGIVRASYDSRNNAIQRCIAHKLRNPEAKAPVRLREELTEDYRRMIYAESRALVDHRRAQFMKK